jgi:hypothetical protein
MPKTIIHRLEIVQIKTHHGKGMFIPAGPVDFHIDKLNKVSSVSNAGQKIDPGYFFFMRQSVFHYRHNSSEDKKGAQSFDAVPIRHI